MSTCVHVDKPGIQGKAMGEGFFRPTPQPQQELASLLQIRGLPGI
jgi:hypothetical protein